MCALAEIDIYILTIFEDVCLWYVSIYVYMSISSYTYICICVICMITPRSVYSYIHLYLSMSTYAHVLYEFSIVYTCMLSVYMHADIYTHVNMNPNIYMHVHVEYFTTLHTTHTRMLPHALTI